MSSSSQIRTRPMKRRLFPSAGVYRTATLEQPVIVLGLFFATSLVLIASVDYPLALWMKTFPQDLGVFAKFLTDLGKGVEFLVATATLAVLGVVARYGRFSSHVLWYFRNMFVSATYLFVAVAGSGLAAALIKNIIGRARPRLMDTYGSLYFRPLAFDADFAAFPSGHSATAGAMAMSLSLVFPRYRTSLMLLGLLICLSRQLVGAHWTSDTAMGWAVGVAFVLWLSHAYARRGWLFCYDEDGYLCRHEAA